MKKTNIQYRIILNEGTGPIIPTNFTIGKDTFKIICKSKKDNLIPNMVPDGVFYGGFVGQYIVEDQKGKKYETYIYLYKKVEGPWCAVVDSMEETT